MSFCHSIFRVYCHVWVKLCAEQLCGFCTSCSLIVCGKLPLQLVFFNFLCRLCIFISVSLKAIESRITQSQNQSAKLATTKHIIHTHLVMEKTHMHGRKKCQNLIVQLSNAHNQVARSLTKQNCFKKNH